MTFVTREVPPGAWVRRWEDGPSGPGKEVRTVEARRVRNAGRGLLTECSGSGFAEFLRRVADHEDMSPSEAFHHSRAMMRGSGSGRRA